MAGMYGVSAYRQAEKAWDMQRKEMARKTASQDKADPAKADQLRADQKDSKQESKASKVSAKEWAPISSTSSLVPKTSEFGTVIGDVQLSEKASDYLDKLKSRFHNLEFITVSKDMKAQVQKNAASYGNSEKMVVLIDEEKLERMAEDESYRKKYEGIIEMSQQKLTATKNSLASTGANIKNFGMSVDSDGREKLFATAEKTMEEQKERSEKKAADRKAKKALEEKKEEKIKEEQKAEERKAELRKEELIREEKSKKVREEILDEFLEEDDKEYVSFEADSVDELVSRVRDFSYQDASNRVMTESERMIGSRVDYRG